MTWVFYGVGAVLLFLVLTSSKNTAPPQTASPGGAPPADPAPFPSQIDPVLVTNVGPKFIQAEGSTNKWDPHRKINFWWDDIPAAATAGSVDTGELSNVHRKDYAGAESCRNCHRSKYDDWAVHPHRWMNALATNNALLGDFSGQKTIKYRGGTGRFIMEAGVPKMILERDDVYWKYRVNRTIGSRFYQYYVGTLEEERGSGLPWMEERKKTDSVLPFGYWLATGEWVPTVHVHRDFDTDESEVDPYSDWQHLPYDRACSDCHTTWAFGDWIIKAAGSVRFTDFTPYPLDVHLGKLLQTAHPDRLPPETDLATHSYADMEQFIMAERKQPHTNERLSLGVTCEGCHLGAAEHAKQSTMEKGAAMPPFFPVNSTIFTDAKSKRELVSRSGPNLNFICAKCHSGTRPMYANGTHTWNSTEFTEASHGHCYHPEKAAAKGMDVLTCISCHDPHKKTGQKWSRTPAQDDASCIRCHTQFDSPAAQAAHSHHEAGTPGSRCMNCHMPKINEGLQDMVRTHRIQSPIDKQMIEANHPNACNLCHLDKPIDWTLKHAAEWYPESSRFAPAKIAASYKKRDEPVGRGWLRSGHAGTRLTGADNLARKMPREYLPALLDLLVNDSHLINRQMVQKSLKESLGLDLKAKGYQFYMTQEDRRATVEKLRSDILKKYSSEKVANATR